jgi:hypothetical protein
MGNGDGVIATVSGSKDCTVDIGRRGGEVELQA